MFEDGVQVEQKNDRREREHKNRRVEEGLFRHFILPVKKRAEAEVDEAGKSCAVEGATPGPFLFLKTPHLPEAVEQQASRDERGNHADRFEPGGACGFRADDQRGGQAPEQGRKSAGELSKRAEQFGVGRCHRGNDEGRMTNGKTNLRTSSGLMAKKTDCTA